MIVKKWIMITDGHRGKVLQKTKSGISNVGFTQHMEPSPNKDKSHHSPGRARSAFSHIRSSYPSHINPNELEIHKFSQDMANFINDREGLFESLMIIAPPKTLGILRKSLSKNALKKITKEISKDYTHTPIEKIMDIL